MTSKAENFSGPGGDPYAVERHFGDIAPAFSAADSNAADSLALGAADRMWQKVEDDLDRIDRAETGEADDE